MPVALVICFIFCKHEVWSKLLITIIISEESYALDAMDVRMLHAVPKSVGSRNYISGDFVNNNNTSKSTIPTDTRFWYDK